VKKKTTVKTTKNSPMATLDRKHAGVDPMKEREIEGGLNIAPNLGHSISTNFSIEFTPLI